MFDRRIKLDKNVKVVGWVSQRGGAHARARARARERECEREFVRKRSLQYVNHETTGNAVVRARAHTRAHAHTHARARTHTHTQGVNSRRSGSQRHKCQIWRPIPRPPVVKDLRTRLAV